ncbi:MAG: tetratricopeptide repeat protein [Flavobacteriales bacterium]
MAKQVTSQNEMLARNYLQQGQYEKALTIFKKLHKKNPSQIEFLLALVETYQQLENFDEAEKLLTQKINHKKSHPDLYVELGHNYALQNKDSLANIQYNIAINFIEENPNYAYFIGKKFDKYSLLNQEAITYEKAMAVDPEIDYNAQLARIYGEQGKLEKMFEKYINLIITKPRYQHTAQYNFNLYITEDPHNEANIILKKLLLQKIQKQPNLAFNELLSWLFIQQKEYKKAFAQEKAIYKRMGDEDLNSILELAIITINDEDYKNASSIINFIIENAPNQQTQLEGKQYLLKIAIKTASKKEYPKIEEQFENLLNEYGSGKETYLLQLDYAQFLAFQYQKKEKAIALLKKLTQQKLSRFQEAKVKMKLADILVLEEKFNQALIYYSQIQKKIKGDVLAQEARFKVAKTSYFKGDFTWSLVQLEVLKKSTTQLIANDAMQLSLIIKDNSLEDSTQTALKKYARADLLSFQKKNNQAINMLKTILEEHKGEKIEDEALLLLGTLYEKTKEYTKAANSYQTLIDYFSEDILADDAYFKLAKLYETKLHQPQKAKEYYQQIIFNFEDSIYFVEARKKFRMLRGDTIE